MQARVSRRQRAVVLMLVFGLFGFKGDACLCGSGHKQPPRLTEAPEPEPFPADRDASVE